MIRRRERAGGERVGGGTAGGLAGGSAEARGANLLEEVGGDDEVPEVDDDRREGDELDRVPPRADVAGALGGDAPCDEEELERVGAHLDQVVGEGEQRRKR